MNSRNIKENREVPPNHPSVSSVLQVRRWGGVGCLGLGRAEVRKTGGQSGVQKEKNGNETPRGRQMKGRYVLFRNRCPVYP